MAGGVFALSLSAERHPAWGLHRQRMSVCVYVCVFFYRTQAFLGLALSPWIRPVAQMGGIEYGPILEMARGHAPERGCGLFEMK